MSLQRLAEVRLALGDDLEAMRLLEEALPIARSSTIARHLLARVFGTMVRAARDAHEARAIVDRAEEMIGWDDFCLFCSLWLTVPAVTACVQTGDLAEAERHLHLAEEASEVWSGTYLDATVAEAQATFAAAQEDAATAKARLQSALERAGQPLDADRCRRVLATL